MKDKMAKLIEITGKALSGEWGNDDNTGNGIPVLRTTNFTNEGIVNYNNVVTRIIEKKKIEEKYLRKGDIIIEKSGGSDKQPVGRVVYFDGPENTYLFNNFTGLLRVKDQAKWYPRYVFYSLFSNYHRGGTRAFQNKTTGLHNLKIDDFVSRCEVTEAGINEQIAACKQMDRVNDIIRMHQQELQKLDELVKARFVEMFGDPERNTLSWKEEELSEHLTVIGGYAFKSELEMSRNVQSGNTQNLKSMVIQHSFPKWRVAERRKTAAASDQAAVCACAHSRYFAGGSPSGLRV